MEWVRLGEMDVWSVDYDWGATSLNERRGFWVSIGLGSRSGSWLSSVSVLAAFIKAASHV